MQISTPGIDAQWSIYSQIIILEDIFFQKFRDDDISHPQKFLRDYVCAPIFHFYLLIRYFCISSHILYFQKIFLKFFHATFIPGKVLSEIWEIRVAKCTGKSQKYIFRNFFSKMFLAPKGTFFKIFSFCGNFGMNIFENVPYGCKYEYTKKCRIILRVFLREKFPRILYILVQKD